MRKFIMFTIAGALVFAAGSAWAQKAAAPRRPTPVSRSVQSAQASTPLTVSNGSVTPTSITFPTSTNPGGSVSDSGSTKVQFTVTNNPAHFTVYAQATASSFTGCNNPPASSVTVACSSATGVTCAAAAALSSTGNGTTVVTGSGNHTLAQFSVTYTFQDSWSYQVGTSCTIGVQYLYTEP
ncbi:MAG: hypothetical protein WB763_19830 [Terriglobia bacterium]|jgi:hypothetical protein